MIIYHGTDSNNIKSIYNNGFNAYMGNYGVASYFSTNYSYVLRHYASQVKNQIIKCEIDELDIKFFESEKAFAKWYREIPTTNSVEDIIECLVDIKDYVLQHGYKAISVKEAAYDCIAVYDNSAIKIIT